jgi:hypothetical protein
MVFWKIGPPNFDFFYSSVVNRIRAPSRMPCGAITPLHRPLRRTVLGSSSLFATREIDSFILTEALLTVFTTNFVCIFIRYLESIIQLQVKCSGQAQNKRKAPLSFFNGCRKRRLKD